MEAVNPVRSRPFPVNTITATAPAGNPGLIVTVTGIYPATTPGNLRAFANVHIAPWGVTIRGVRVIQQPGMRAYTSLPQTQDKQGRWWPVIQADDDQLKQTVQAAVLAAWQTHRGTDL